MIHRQQATTPTAKPYDRHRELPPLVAMWPREIADFSEKGCLNVVAQIEKALRGERRRGKAGHWTYSLARHMSLLKALKAEQVILKQNTAKHMSTFRTPWRSPLPHSLPNPSSLAEQQPSENPPARQHKKNSHISEI